MSDDWREELIEKMGKAFINALMFDDGIRAALEVAEPVIREQCAAMAEVAAKRDLAYADKYPDEAQKMEDRAHRAKTIAAAIREGWKNG